MVSVLHAPFRFLPLNILFKQKQSVPSEALKKLHKENILIEIIFLEFLLIFFF